MKKLVWFSLAILLVAGGCGPQKIEVTQDKPLIIEHKLDLTDLEKYFEVKCKKELTVEDDLNTPADESYTPTKDEIDDCVDLKVTDFLDVIK